VEALNPNGRLKGNMNGIADYFTLMNPPFVHPIVLNGSLFSRPIPLIGVVGADSTKSMVASGVFVTGVSSVFLLFRAP
jgi:hypothetical protein